MDYIQQVLQLPLEKLLGLLIIGFVGPAIYIWALFRCLLHLFGVGAKRWHVKFDVPGKKLAEVAYQEASMGRVLWMTSICIAGVISLVMFSLTVFDPGYFWWAYVYVVVLLTTAAATSVHPNWQVPS